MKQSLAAPIVLITLGSAWFLKSTSLLPDTATLLALLLAATGVLLIIVDGLNKSTLVSAPMLVYGGAAVYYYDSASLRMSHVLSLGMVLLGILLLFARSDRIPERSRPLMRRREEPARGND
ncbi:hypothetical protein [Paludibacterium paludis]|uniref:Uncharacterized protein n=1 Tax=Paludibacterium paludis TaxID=1225769 RepID=A0A918P4F2_9NEIS|nr:hypothetical protein [Paludibacterium paludis]GGY21884.1 hypothetical protein GCM10011289_27040 [Paludibacterium paludis]